MSKRKHKSFARWSRGMDNKFKAENMNEEKKPIVHTPSPHGLLESTIAPEDYVFGGTTKMPDRILRPDGQWDDFLPEKEVQNKNGFETNACTVFGTLNCLEAQHKQVCGFEKNWSERFTAIMANVDPNQGGYPEKVIESIRKNDGMVLETLLPFDDTVTTKAKFYSPKPMVEPYLTEAKRELAGYTIYHEWINPITTYSLKEALKRSPVGISVWAWSYDPNTGYYVNPNKETSNHWVMIYGYEDGKYWKCYDHYNQDHKKLAWNFPFGFAKKYYLEKNPPMLETQADGTIDNKPVPKGSVITLEEAFKFVVAQIGYLGYLFKKLGSKIFK